MQKVCKSKDGGLNDALKLARRVRSRTMGSSEVPRSSSVGAAGDQGHGDAQQPIAHAAQAKLFAPAVRRQPVSKGSALSQPASF